MFSHTGAPLIAFACCLSLAGAPVAHAAAAPEAEVAEATTTLAGWQAVDTPQTVSDLAEWVRRTHDNQDLPFVIIDKTAAVAALYAGDGEMMAVTPVLIGLTVGDDSVPGIGDRELRDVRPEDRTTPAGRFIGGYGPAADGKRVLWVDFPTALSLHPVVTSNPRERRLERLESPAIDDNRISFGCINVPPSFYSDMVEPMFANNNGVFYILPEQKTVAEVFPDFAATMQASVAAPTDHAELDLDALAASLESGEDRIAHLDGGESAAEVTGAGAGLEGAADSG
ncbi:MAG TPA: L,D-transpeptidase [Caulobacteraceae bacterium]